jgi:hypothetical protein
MHICRGNAEVGDNWRTVEGWQMTQLGALGRELQLVENGGGKTYVGPPRR